MASFGHPRVAVALGTTKFITGVPMREVTRPDFSGDDIWDGSEQGEITLSKQYRFNKKIIYYYVFKGL